MSFFTRLNRPWLHFLLLGAGLYYLQSQLFPPPKPVVGPLGVERIEGLRQQWAMSTGQSPTDAQLERMVAVELDRDMLFQRALELELHRFDAVVYQRLVRNMQFLGLGEGRSDAELYEEALAMRLHLGDEVVKRRMVQVMEQLLLAEHPPSPPSEEEIAAAFAARRDELRRPPRYTIEQLYFPREREADVPQVVATIAARGLQGADARELGSPFLPGYHFERQTPDQLARQFGAAFVRNLQEARPQAGHWHGPLRSTYGLHYVWVSAVEPARDATLEEVRGQLLRDLESQARATALRESIDAMRADFEVRT